MSPKHSSSRSRTGVFIDTPWEILSCGPHRSDAQTRKALSQLCRLYRQPTFCVLLSRGFNRTDADDLTQGFLLRFIQSSALARAHPRKGRFRDFLLGALDHYLLDLRAREQTKKRGGQVERVPLDARRLGEAHAALARQRRPDLSSASDWRWAVGLMQDVLADLHAEYDAVGDGLLFRLLKPHWAGSDGPQTPYSKIALRLHRSPANLRSDVKRIRARYREKLRERLRAEFGASRVEAEWQNLREILRSSQEQEV